MAVAFWRYVGWLSIMAARYAARDLLFDHIEIS